MSRTVRFTEAGAPEVLRFVEESVRGPGRGEVRINVKAIGLNRAEAMWRTDRYIEPVRFPAGLGYEAAGIVDAVGEGVVNFAPGDEVSVIPSFSMNQYFTYGEVIIVPDHAVVRHPKSLSFAEAASVWMMFVTAYGALIEDARVGAGDHVVVPAASSSVGLAAIQLANYSGATSIAVTRHAGKRQQLLDAGAAHVIVTDESDLVEEIMRITDGKGARVAFDPVGGPNFAKLIEALSFQGIAYLYGALDERATTLPVLQMIARMNSVKAHNIWLTSGDPTRRKAAVEFVLKGLGSGSLKPVIDRTFAFDEIVDAHRYLETNGQFGKIVVTV
ncbi:NADPH:quinone reductase-like Zn-dependent oxidoreductase [Paraburkholderia youngii]|uniref:Zinc-dependent alcohol dehydrogenase family protein n=1 Tax=Paraburkholderia youngii TaxID=2782701 RepID=A0A7Y6K5B3_9BURK|nr:zinc-dependent alcohol dehydrogenase family protein [Paraburkholderia youngii]NUY04109.1 zinc-dependent alcohol dehydrogenase family protein [Paraburkholderia youngii]